MVHIYKDYTVYYFILYYTLGLNIGGGLIIRNLSFDYKDSGDKYKLNLNDLSFFNLIIIFVFFISYYVNLIIVNSLDKTNSFCNLNKTPEEYTIIVTNLPGDKDEEELKIELTEVIYFYYYRENLFLLILDLFIGGRNF